MKTRQPSSLNAKIVPSLWYTKDAAEAAEFYVSLFPDSSVDLVMPLPIDSPNGPEGSVDYVEFTLAGQSFTAISAGPLDPFNHAISFTVNCDDQAEIDRLWDALSEGGETEHCGWLRDRYGVAWQIVPSRFVEMMADPDKQAVQRAMAAMMGMVKFDVAELERAFAQVAA